MYQVTQEDKDIAIGLWESIRDDWLKNPEMSLSMYKYRFLFRLGYADKWRNNCLLCTYYSYYEDGSQYPWLPCKQCPLLSCVDMASEYMNVSNTSLSLEDRINACNKIIKCIEDVEVENDYT